MSGTTSRIAHVGAAAAIGLLGYFLYSSWSKSKKKTASSLLNLPVIDFELYLNRDKSAEAKTKYLAEGKRAADALHKYGVCVVRDPRVDQKHNDTFIDMMER